MMPKKWGTPRLWAFTLAATLSQMFVLAQEKPVSYDLKVKIEPRQGYVAVRGKIRVPVEADAKTLQFGLHETLQVKKLRMNRRAVTFTVSSGGTKSNISCKGKCYRGPALGCACGRRRIAD